MSENGPLFCQHSITLVAGMPRRNTVEAIVGLEGVDLVDGEVPGDLHLAGLQRRGAGGRLDDRAIDHLLDIGFLAPVILVAGHDHALAADPFDELERSVPTACWPASAPYFSKAAGDSM